MQNVLTYLQENEPGFVRELCEYVRFPSVSAQSHHKKDVQAAAEWLLARAESVGLRARLCKTDGNPVVVAQTTRAKPAAESRPRPRSKPHFLVYGHYDVQPAEPFELWTTPPFEPRVENRSLFGRGASDNKGQHFAHLKAVEAYLKTDTELPCDLTFVIEGEEEVGSRSLPAFLKKHRNELSCDAIVISDTGMPDLAHPALTYALRGIVALDVKLAGPSRDLHSGIYGGSVDNPAMALCQLLARLRDKNGRITIPGFYNDVRPLSAYERRQLARIPFSEASYRKFLGVPKLFGERGFTPQEQRSARPTLEINGLTSGYQGEGSKTIIPAWASAKLTFRLVPNQTPERIRRLVAQHLRRFCPPTVRLEMQGGHGGEPYAISPTGPLAQAGLRALKAAFGHEPVLLREGGSIPIV
ncbi:MAG TPA: dipeptidase, partial [Verrucomicrobiae bacterium]|nr:dipeptidase [Verrucomicrobiae bacterium]